jgi:uncharacterized membrane protein
MAKALAGFFRTPADAKAAYDALVAAGIPSKEIGLVMGDTRGHDLPAVGPIQDSGADSEAPKDAWIGSAVGLVAGMFAFLIPGIGPLIAAGPLAGAIGGMGVGAAAGGLIGLLKDHGVSEDEAEFYAEGVKRGGALITVHGIPEEREKDMRKILNERGAITVEQLANEWRTKHSAAEPEQVRRAG